MAPASHAGELKPPSPRVADHIFELFSKPLRVALLAELSSGPSPRSALIATLGAAESTLDALLNELDEAGLILRRRSREFPTQTIVSLAPGPGQDLAVPLDQASRWLARAGLSPLKEQDRKTGRVASHVWWCWHHRLVDLLTLGPVSLNRLMGVEIGASASSIQSHLRQLVAFGLVDVTSNAPRRTNFYELSRLGHELLGVLAAFVRWELRHHPGTAERLTRRDVATAIRMACSLIDPGQMRPGRYAFVVNLADGSPSGLIVDFAPDGWRAIINPTGPVRHGIRAYPLPWLDAILDLSMSGNRQDPKDRLDIRPADCPFVQLVHGAIAAE